MAHPALILASQSPRRRELLAQAGYDFQVVPPHETAECGVCSRETAPELVARLAFQKAQDVALRFPQGLILGCDTVAACCGQILGKPEHREHAREMLRLMRGREHQVYSGVCLWRRPENRTWGDVVMTRLIMDPLTDEQIEHYLDTDGWVGKAGAFGYQDGLDWVHVLEGSESNVVGLPLERLAVLLGSEPMD
jgi:septum formation protein